VQSYGLFVKYPNYSLYILIFQHLLVILRPLTRIGTLIKSFTKNNAKDNIWNAPQGIALQALFEKWLQPVLCAWT
jgi:hypothetical protein